MAKIDGVDCVYTKQGNPYKKSSTGKKVGTAIGVTAFVVPQTIPYKVYEKLAYKISPMVGDIFSNAIRQDKLVGVESGIDFVKKFIKGDKRLLKDLCNGKLPNFAKSKGKRAAMIAGLAVLILGTYVGVGRLVGHCFDKIREARAKTEADRRAAQEV